MFMDKWDGAAPLTRAWCVWEIFGVAKAKKQLEIALPESEFVNLNDEDLSSILKRAPETRCYCEGKLPKCA